MRRVPHGATAAARRPSRGRGHKAQPATAHSCPLLRANSFLSRIIQSHIAHLSVK
ncbi:hypothetical protein MYA_2217 [Burkholderia sp. KJ006]|nr:hypothetical protein MYA_2217 [Burkholderia sp. KJ006]